MPEGPEIRRAADDIANVVEGKKALEVHFGLPVLAHYGRTLSGQKVLRIETRGKALLTHFASGHSVYSHNQLYGKWYVVKRNALPETQRQLRFAIHTEHHSALLYSASDITVMSTSEIENHPFVARIGPDVMSSELSAEDIVARLKSRRFNRRTLSALYLDQKFVAGLGNYLRSEILFAAGLNPGLKPIELDEDALQSLADATLHIAIRSYQTKGFTVPDALRDSAMKSGMSFEEARFMVFDREDFPCRICSTRIQRKTAQSRRIYHCPTCQPGA